MISVMSRARILIADDHALLSEGLATLLRQKYDVVGIVADGHQMLAEAERLQPDLITLDIGMPNLNGLEAARQVRKLVPEAKLVFVTQQIDLRYLQAALKVGANAFVAKQSASNELFLAVDAALNGRLFITPMLDEAFSAVSPVNLERKNDFGDVLTPRQREVLQLIAEGHTNRSIASHLSISVKTVEFHRESIMRSLGLRSVAELVRYAVSLGIVSA
jgi:DNA-binding NarL/FixJ family response regulator